MIMMTSTIVCGGINHTDVDYSFTHTTIKNDIGRKS
jgi:hypothetical protein